jgi:hypothetical protein
MPNRLIAAPGHASRAPFDVFINLGKKIRSTPVFSPCRISYRHNKLGVLEQTLFG